MKIIIFTDSLGRPRPDLSDKEKTEYEEVYGYKIKDHFAKHCVELIYIESLDTEDAIFWNERMVAFKRPDIVIYHIGINDCVPRIFKKNSRSILLNPWFKKISNDVFLRVIHKYRRHIIKLFPLKVYVKKETFRKNLFKMILDVKHFSNNCHFFCLSITGQTNSKEMRSPGIKQSVNEHNEILKNIFTTNFIDIDTILNIPPEKYLISDGIHLNKEAHVIVAKVLITKIEQIISLCAE